MTDYELRDDLLYDTHYNWVKIEDDIAIFGITDAGVKRANDIAFIELPEVGKRVTAEKACGQIESAKWAGEIISPLNGEITEVNKELEDDPTKLNNAPYDSWIAKIRIIPDDAGKLMDTSAAKTWLNAQN